MHLSGGDGHLWENGPPLCTSLGHPDVVLGLEAEVAVWKYPSSVCRPGNLRDATYLSSPPALATCHVREPFFCLTPAPYSGWAPH